MNTHLKLSTFLALIVLGFFAYPRAASAQPYVTAAAGVSGSNIDCGTFPSCERTGVAFNVTGGDRLARWFAGEAVYLDFGDSRKSSNFSEDTMKTSGVGGGVAFHGHAGSWTVTARAGAARAAAERVVSVGQVKFDGVTFSDVAPYAGVGLSYRFTSYVALTFGFDAMRSRWERSDGQGWTWMATAATAGVTIGR